MICKRYSLRSLLTRFKADSLSTFLFLTASLMLVMSLIFYLISVFSA